MDVFEAIWTTRAMRRLDAAHPVPDEDLVLILTAAGKAPSGGNSQPVRWVVVRDAELRRRVGDIYRAVARPRLEQSYGGSPLGRSALHLADHLGEAPVILVPCGPREAIRPEGSVYPAIQNLMLAARARGLGTTLTSLHKENESALKTLLGIPEEVDTFALIPVGYPLGRWGEAQRKPVGEITYWDGWGRVRPDLAARTSGSSPFPSSEAHPRPPAPSAP